MFTFGIFTSHLPYVAVVAFYAYFLIFGVNKAANGEIEVVDHTIKIEFQSGDSGNKLNDASIFHYQKSFDSYSQIYFEDCIFKREIKLLESSSTATRRTGFNTSYCNRPPPVLV